MTDREIIFKSLMYLATFAVFVWVMLSFYLIERENKKLQRQFDEAMEKLWAPKSSKRHLRILRKEE